MTEIDPRKATLENWRTSPFCRWSFQNLGEIIPTAAIAGGQGPEADAGAALFDGITVNYPDGQSLPLSEHLARSSADALVAMRDGTVIAEWYAPEVDRDKAHTIFSISKSVTGMLAGIAVGEGKLDAAAPVSRYVPVPSGTAYAEASVRDLLDMTVALDFEENYLDRTGPFGRYRRAMLWNPCNAGETPETLEQVLTSLPPAARPHGQAFYYASPNADMLGLVIERATGMPYHVYLGEKLWRPMGARGPAFVTVDRVGTARASGGICSTARDLARFGQLVLDGGRTADGAQLIPAEWVEDMRAHGDRQAWATGNFWDMFVGGRYRSGWYQTGNPRDAFCGVGIHGQWLWIDPVSRLVIVRLCSRAEASDDALSEREIRVLGAISRALSPGPV
ncbi:MAG: serine hydrolase [Rhizobiales bacterium]|nr:serine hydrolase [Hyphomicrobiales bacterium]